MTDPRTPAKADIPATIAITAGLLIGALLLGIGLTLLGGHGA